MVNADEMLNFHLLSKQKREGEFSNENSSVYYLLSLWGHYSERAENMPLIIEVDWNISQLLCLHAKHTLVFQCDWKKVKTNSQVQILLLTWWISFNKISWDFFEKASGYDMQW